MAKEKTAKPESVSTPYGSGVLIRFVSTVEIKTDNFTFDAGVVYDVCEASAARWERRNLATRVDNTTGN